MHETTAATPSPWHAGEKQMQARIGVAELMEDFGRKVIRGYMPEQHRDFYRQLPFVILGAVDEQGRPWASILEGVPGFAHSPEPRTLQLDANLAHDDAAASALQVGAAVGLIGIELHTRRRNRLNGNIHHAGASGLSIAVEQTFGNCPQYIQARQFELRPAVAGHRAPAEHLDQLDERARAMIAQADTFFVASYIKHADGRLAVDASHRGGQKGFVRVVGNRLSIPDFAGNLHFNTLGNLLLNPRAGLLFIDFANGDLLQISGRAELTLEGEEIGAFQGAERLWHVEVERLVRRPAALALRWQFQGYSPNSMMTGNWADAEARLAATALREQWRPMQVMGVVEESASVRSLYLKPADGAGQPSFAAGQHLPLRLHIPGMASPVIRTYSLSCAPSDGWLRISVKRIGVASAFLHEQIEVGSLLEARMPQGRFVLDAQQRRPVVLLAAGIGATPLLAMLREVIYQNHRLRRARRVWWIQSARHVAELVFRDELSSVLQHGGEPIRAVRVISQPEAQAQKGVDFERAGHIDVPLLQSLLPPDDYDFYLCGPSAFTQTLYDGLRDLDISDARIHAETFGPSSLHRRPDHGSVQPALPAPADGPVPVLFERSAKEARWMPANGSLLELAEQRGLSPEFSCRGGSCGTCKTRVISGAVTYPQPPPALPEDGYALICCAVPAASAAGGPTLVLDL
ncbi:MAG: pyridoxamine 5'-phosphate oxidase family protein [Xanthomonadaceae bacterium]|nr:pyridoxamine 5'-phosphate oxidase family protein [Xanthomonadaceae bacterium]